MELGLEANTQATKYTLQSSHKNAGQNHGIKTGNRCFENVAQFRYLEKTVTNQNLLQEEIKRRLNSGNASYITCIIRMIKSRRMRLADHVARMGKTRNAYRILVGKPEGKRSQGRPRCRWVNNIRMDLRERGWDGMDWIDLAQCRDQWRALVNEVMNLRVP
ncbi:hypothetical protein B7P43_G16981 [Cryptotermes secundus]|uniref:Uncharacterized protein n=1 Tax=Cryptotermes secundus TaxID=105785 RepID=A0A2J7PFD4_9NEOP|nr:hypothetical protein B7P43_G16981 [Cryptotermes secundus]